ncbi:hypothetical protein FTUN_4441 [Frigoriglobus tundricola]|uniref:Uncharacterized protein n=1 Tax=Frigoriglobus tundricola TaxID=2774151 RepID=A0A6M5YUF8_9BACT|nr:hypothetical protein FTUN_4441 [Frigoriglobus tundricola]
MRGRCQRVAGQAGPRFHIFLPEHPARTRSTRRPRAAAVKWWWICKSRARPRYPGSYGSTERQTQESCANGPAPTANACRRTFDEPVGFRSLAGFTWAGPVTENPTRVSPQHKPAAEDGTSSAGAFATVPAGDLKLIACPGSFGGAPVIVIPFWTRRPTALHRTQRARTQEPTPPRPGAPIHKTEPAVLLQVDIEHVVAPCDNCRDPGSPRVLVLLRQRPPLEVRFRRRRAGRGPRIRLRLWVAL